MQSCMYVCMYLRMYIFMYMRSVLLRMYARRALFGMHMNPRLNSHELSTHTLVPPTLPSAPPGHVPLHVRCQCILSVCGIHTMSHHHTYYVTSSYILCHIIIHTMSHHQVPAHPVGLRHTPVSKVTSVFGKRGPDASKIVLRIIVCARLAPAQPVGLRHAQISHETSVFGKDGLDVRKRDLRIRQKRPSPSKQTTDTSIPPAPAASDDRGAALH